MITFVLLPLQENMVQRSASKHHQWRGYMTVLVVHHGIIKSMIIHTAVIQPMINFHLDPPQDCFLMEAMWTMAIRYQLSTLSALDLGRVHHFPHALPQEKDTYCLAEGNQ
jgi:hypothetical protein